MNFEEFEALRAQVAIWRRQAADSAFGRIPASIDHLRKRIGASDDEEDRKGMYSLLLSECGRAQNPALMHAVAREQLDAYPNDPIALIEMAGAISALGADDEAVFTLTRRAVDQAAAHNAAVRYTLVWQAREALRRLNAAAFGEALDLLIQDACNDRAQDTGLEIDFLDTVPDGFVSEAQLAAYRSL